MFVVVDFFIINSKFLLLETIKTCVRGSLSDQDPDVDVAE